MKFFISFLLLLAIAQARDISPSFGLHTVGSINDFVVDAKRLYVATERGSVDVFDLSTKKIVHQIVLEPIVSYQDKMIPASVLSVDVLNAKVLIVSHTKENYRDVWIYENYTLRQVVDAKQKLMIKEAHFVDDKHIIFATVDSDIIMYELSEDYQVYHNHISQSTLGDMILSKDKKKIITADESGEIRVFDVQSSKEEIGFPAENLDKVFHIAHSGDVTITAGQDRRVAVYETGKKPYHIKNDFIVYCVGLSPSGRIGVYSSTEENYLQVFDTSTKQKKDRLVGHKNIINQIIFINETMLFSSDQGHDIYFWEL